MGNSKKNFAAVVPFRKCPPAEFLDPGDSRRLALRFIDLLDRIVFSERPNNNAAFRISQAFVGQLLDLDLRAFERAFATRPGA